MILWKLHPIFWSAYLALALFPLLLIAYFIIVGRSHRHRMLVSLAVAKRPASEFLAAEEEAESNQTLGQYLTSCYNQLQAVGNYVGPVAIFMLPYLLGVYWALVGLAFTVADPEAELWKSQAPILKASLIPALGLLGGAISALWHIASRIIRNDVSPRMFTHQAIRLVVAPVFAVVVAVAPAAAAGTPPPVLVLALLSGFFPSAAFRFVSDKFDEWTGNTLSPTASLSLRAIQGIEREEELRLWEEGIVDAEHLACEGVVFFLVHTNYSLERIIDWKDQAFLYVYAPNDLETLRGLYTRGAMDVLGLHAQYLGEKEAKTVQAALAKLLKKPEPVVHRFVDTIYNDPRVHQLWEYLVRSHPTHVAKPIIERMKEVVAQAEGK